MVVNGWKLYSYPLFDDQLRRLTKKVQAAANSDPLSFKDRADFKLLATIHRHVWELIPANPNSPEFRLGNTLGKDNRHWFRAKFHQRYRLFFRFSTKDKLIVYGWVNDESSLRKAGSRTDSYALFQSMLESGDPPASMEQLLVRSKEIQPAQSSRSTITTSRQTPSN